jgi:hypothetical protein
MLPALAADAARDVRRISPVLEIVSTGSDESVIERRRPLRLGLGEPPNLIRGQAQITKHLPKRLARIDSCQELLPHLNM